jgi:hypothetical protein
MRTTVSLDNEQIAKARELTGIARTSTLLQEALTALIQREAARRLRLLVGTEPNLKAAPRR